MLFLFSGICTQALRDVKIPHSRMTKTCRETVVPVFEIYGTKGHLYHLLGVSDYCIIYRQRVTNMTELMLGVA